MTMQLLTVNAFIQATADVLRAELAVPVRRGVVAVRTDHAPAGEIVTLISFTGDLCGTVLFGMSIETALAIVGRMMGQPFPELDDLACSGVAELSNVIAGTAMTMLAKVGYRTDIAPPVMSVATGGARISTPNLPRLSVPLETELGRLDLQLAYRGRG